MSAPLSVGKVLLGAFLVPWWNRRAFARALAVPLALLATQTLTWHYAMREVPAWANWLLCLLWGFLFTLFAVTVHRLVLLDAGAVSRDWRPAWTWRESRFFLWTIAIWLLYLAVFWVGLTTAGIFLANTWRSAFDGSRGLEWIAFFGSIPALYVFARLSLVFPATALDDRPRLRWAWEQTRNNGWRLVLVVGALPWVLSAAVGVLYRNAPSVVETILLTVVGTALFAIEIAALSISYRELTKA